MGEGDLPFPGSIGSLGTSERSILRKHLQMPVAGEITFQGAFRGKPRAHIYIQANRDVHKFSLAVLILILDTPWLSARVQGLCCSSPFVCTGASRG